MRKPGPWLAGAAVVASAGASLAATPTPADYALANRLTWGATPADAKAIAAQGQDRWIERQLHPASGDRLPPSVQLEIDALPISHERARDELVSIAGARLLAGAASTTPEQKQAANQAYQRAMTEIARQAATRSVLRDLYSPDQLREQMTWFWFNHFNIDARKRQTRILIGEFEDQAIRDHALGRFRDLLEATLRSPAMLEYLDNAQNASGKINENYAREIMELHTLGVGSGYTQKDVQELARILTGVGIDPRPQGPKLSPALQDQLIRDGLFEFNPNRHDYGDKVFLGHRIKGRGFAEVEEALEILSRQPATAHHVSTQLATYFVSDAPPEALVQRMAATFQHSDGDIAAVLETMFRSPEFTASLGTKFKDPMHYVISAVRLAYPDQTVVNVQPMLGWLNRLGQGIYQHETPDGYPMTAAAWNGPGQMETRFEIAHTLAAGQAGLFKPDIADAAPMVGPPLLKATYDRGLSSTVAPATRGALSQASDPADFNTLFLASPEFMRR